MENKRVCPKCCKKKSLDQFKVRANGKPAGYCHPCSIDYIKEYNAKRYASPEARAAELARGKEKYAKQGKQARLLRKCRLIHLMGGKCQGCGYDKSAAALDFDHLDPTTKSRTISHLLAVNQPWAWEAAIAEAKKCQLLCSNCHREKTYPGCALIPLVDAFEQFPGTLLEIDTRIGVGDIPGASGETHHQIP